MAIDFSPAEVRAYYAVRVPGLKAVGGEWRGPCPVHMGTRDSFAVNPMTGQAYCHSQCGRGWDMIGLERELTGVSFATAREVIFGIVGRPEPTQPDHESRRTPYSRTVACYDYTNENGQLLFQTVRLDSKDFRQRRPNGKGGWVWNLRGVSLVLYRLPKLLERKTETVYICEGEKDVHAVERVGLLATCNPMGAGKWREQYADTLRGRHVVIFTDNDPPTDEKGNRHYKGQKHAATVAASLLGQGCDVRIIEPPIGKDVSDWLAAGGTTDEIAALVSAQSALTHETLAAWTEQWNGPGKENGTAMVNWPEPASLQSELPQVQPFSENLLPIAFRPFVRDAAERMQVPMDYPAVAVLLCLAGCVSRRATIQPKAKDIGWIVVPNLWGGIIAPPGFLKSPVIQAVTRPLNEVQTGWRRDYDEAQQRYAEAKEESELQLAAWKEQYKKNIKTGRPMPDRPTDKPEEPISKRLIVNDATFEALHQTMSENPAGILVIRDELTGWWSTLDRTGREGERAFCLQAWNGDTGHTIDRIGRGTVYVDACCMSMVGGIQPGRLRSYLADALHDGPSNDGLIQRFQLLVWPDTDLEWEYVDRRPDQAVEAQVKKSSRLWLNWITRVRSNIASMRVRNNYLSNGSRILRPSYGATNYILPWCHI